MVAKSYIKVPNLIQIPPCFPFLLKMAAAGFCKIVHFNIREPMATSICKLGKNTRWFYYMEGNRLTV